jgi:hypothetical protein
VAEAKPPAAAKPKTKLNLLGLLKAPVKAKVRDADPSPPILTALYRTCLHGTGDSEGTEQDDRRVLSHEKELQLLYV